MRHRAAAGLVFWGAVLAATVIGGRKPVLNWDGIAYVALALERDVGVQEAHRQSYAYLLEAAPATRFEELTAATPYRRAMAEDPRAFAETLRFYRMRQGYVGLLSGAHRLFGTNPFQASTYVGIASFVLLAAAVWAWSGRAVSVLGESRPEGEWLRLAALVLILQPAAAGSIALATPDLLAGSLLVWGAYFWAARGMLWASLPFFGLAVLARPDALVLASTLLCAPALVAAAFRDREEFVRSLLPFAGGIGVAATGIFLAWHFEAHSWGTLFRHTFVENAVFPEPRWPGLLEYVKALGAATVLVGYGLPARILFGLGALAVVYLWLHPLVPQRRRVLAAATLAAQVAFFLLFPLPAERFFVAHVVVVGALLFESVVELGALSLEEGRPLHLALLRPRLAAQSGR